MKLGYDFFARDVLTVAPELLGKILVRKFPDGTTIKLRIVETEAYRGTDDLACHASKGKTLRTEPMFMEAGTIYIYLIYGMYWMLNIVCSEIDNPQAVLIRGAGKYNGPGKLTKALKIDKTFNKTSIFENEFLWIEDDGFSGKYSTSPRVGIDYAGEPWISMPWNFKLTNFKVDFY